MNSLEGQDCPVKSGEVGAIFFLAAGSRGEAAIAIDSMYLYIECWMTQIPNVERATRDDTIHVAEEQVRLRLHYYCTSFCT